MNYRRVKTGDEIEIKAETWNSFLSAAESVQNHNKYWNSQGGGGDGCIIRVQNLSGAAMEQYSAVAVTGVISEPDNSNVNASSTVEFAGNLVLKVGLPTSFDAGRWLVLLEPVANNAIGPAMAIGLTQAWINLGHVAHTCVEISNGSAVPVSGTNGFKIIWVAGGVGTATATGNQYAVIRLGNSVDTFPVRITAVSGSFPTWTYTAQRIVSYNSSLTGAARWVTDGVNLTIINRCEFAGSGYPYTYGTGNNITASDGTVNSTGCKAISFTVGSTPTVQAIPNTSDGGIVYSFFDPNSSQ